MKRRRLHVLLASGTLVFLLAAGARGEDTDSPPGDLRSSSPATESAPSKVEPPPGEVEKILELKELLEMMGLLQDLDVLLQLEDKK